MEKVVKREVLLGSRHQVEVSASHGHPGPGLPKNVLHSRLVISDLDDTMVYWDHQLGIWTGLSSASSVSYNPRRINHIYIYNIHTIYIQYTYIHTSCRPPRDSR